MSATTLDIYDPHTFRVVSLQPDENDGIERALHGYHYRRVTIRSGVTVTSTRGSVFQRSI